jgi:hypothetical protein
MNGSMVSSRCSGFARKEDRSLYRFRQLGARVERVSWSVGIRPKRERIARPVMEIVAPQITFEMPNIQIERIRKSSQCACMASPDL